MDLLDVILEFFSFLLSPREKKKRIGLGILIITVFFLLFVIVSIYLND